MDLEKYRQVIADAIQGEIEARQFYEKIAEGIQDAYLKKTFKGFAAEEGRHEKILTEILNREKTDTRYFNFDKDFKVAETIDLPEVTPTMDLKDAIGIAMKNEEIAMKKYLALADNCEDPDLKKVFLDLASMERDHKFKMEASFVDVAYPEIW